MLWPAFMFEAWGFLRLRKTSSFCNTGQEKSPSSPLQSINRGHILLERGRGDGQLQSLWLPWEWPSSKPSRPMSVPHHQVASTVKIDLL